jgi:hypothetical protein
MTKDPPRSEAEIELMKRQIAVQLDEYEAAILAYADWIRNWRAKQKRAGFRRARRKA